MMMIQFSRGHLLFFKIMVQGQRNNIRIDFSSLARFPFGMILVETIDHIPVLSIDSFNYC